MEFEHEITLTALNAKYEDLSRSLKAKITRFNQMKAGINFNNKSASDKKRQNELITYSAAIADEILDFYEKDFPDAAPERVFTPEEKEERRREFDRIREKLKANGN